MKKSHKALAFVLLLSSASLTANARQWTLQECISYALSNNISLQKTRVQHLSAIEDVKQSKAALLPSLSGSTSHNVSYNPWPETGSYTIAGSRVQSQVDKVFYNGSYGINANWTVWNGNRNRNQVKLNQMTADQAALDSAVTANTIQEQIAQLFVQILYSQEAVEVDKATLETSKKNEERGKEFVKVGNMSKADLAQLTAQRAQDEYNVVQAESTLKDYKRQLKQLLQITDQDEFDVVVPTTTDEMALQTIPTVPTVYDAALSYRPEIQNAQLGIKSSDLSIKIAKAQRMPTIGLSASASTSTTTMSSNAWSKQMKNNFVTGAGVTLSIPILDQRETKTAVNKAILQRQNYELDLRDKQTTLYSTIENYWLQAYNNQAQFKSAKVSTESAQASYDLLQEQFKQNLKNVIELMNGKDALLKAKQAELQAKYLAIYNIDMLNFYKTGELK
ncbi:MAG: TolC family protein [Prevotella sp.]|nr:TolC family protein [Prevotella sp.]